MHSEHGTRKPIPNRDSISGADYNESATKVLFTRNESARQSGAKKEHGSCCTILSARWCGNKEMRCIRGMVFFSFLLPGLRWRRGDEVTESRDDDRDDDRYRYLSLRSLNRRSRALPLARSARAPLTPTPSTPSPQSLSTSPHSSSTPPSHTKYSP